MQGGTLICSCTCASVRSQTRAQARCVTTHECVTWYKAWCMCNEAVKALLALLGGLKILRAHGSSASADSHGAILA